MCGEREGSSYWNVGSHLRSAQSRSEAASRRAALLSRSFSLTVSSVSLGSYSIFTLFNRFGIVSVVNPRINSTAKVCKLSWNRTLDEWRSSRKLRCGNCYRQQRIEGGQWLWKCRSADGECGFSFFPHFLSLFLDFNLNGMTIFQPLSVALQMTDFRTSYSSGRPAGFVTLCGWQRYSTCV